MIVSSHMYLTQTLTTLLGVLSLTSAGMFLSITPVIELTWKQELLTRDV